MCNCTPHILLAHLLGLLLGIVVIAELVRRRFGPRLFWCAIYAMSLTMAAYVFKVSEPWPYFDDFKVYWIAGSAALRGPNAVADLYGVGVDGFVNMPILAYLFAPIAILPQFPAAMIFLLIGIVLTLVAWRLLSRAADLNDHAKALLLFITAAFGPLLYSIREGNTAHMLLVLIVGAMLLLRERRDALAGAALGFAALIKPPLLLLGVYFVLRGRWHAVLGGAGIVVTISLASLALFGWSAHVHWYETSIAPYARDPVPAMNVHSIAAALARLQYGPTSLLDWQPRKLATPLQILATASNILLVGLALASALAPRSKAARPVSRQVIFETELLIALMLATTISPLSWSHYYVWLLIPIAFFVGRTQHFCSTLPGRGIGWLAVVVAAPPVVRLSFDQTLLSELHGRIGSSHLLIGGLAILGLLIWSRWRMREASSSTINLDQPLSAAPS